jgi:hypothetical protein
MDCVTSGLTFADNRTAGFANFLGDLVAMKGLKSARSAGQHRVSLFLGLIDVFITDIDDRSRINNFQCFHHLLQSQLVFLPIQIKIICTDCRKLQYQKEQDKIK